ncbi:hypothetical protein DPMN_084780 [Dreissena polymorpha]|uniref:Uncharacterized protein n=1 Tax=Dreissena polymorpha TaxID=45954 RepID=A0A9D4BIU1_DREPO|nr:hypothetical protein DPMN_084780 [Dreissena polymorpha]
MPLEKCVPTDKQEDRPANGGQPGLRSAGRQAGRKGDRHTGILASTHTHKQHSGSRTVFVMKLY